MPQTRAEPARRSRPAPEPRWPLWAGVIVALGCLATIAYAVIETFWG